MSVKLLTEHHLEFLSLKGGCTGSSESTLVKIPHCCKSHVTAHLYTDGFCHLEGYNNIGLVHYTLKGVIDFNFQILLYSILCSWKGFSLQTVQPNEMLHSAPSHWVYTVFKVSIYRFMVYIIFI